MRPESLVVGASGATLGAQATRIIDKARRREKITACDVVELAASAVTFVCAAWELHEARKRQAANC